MLAVEKHTIEKDIAAYIKKEYEKKYAPSFHWSQSFTSLIADLRQDINKFIHLAGTFMEHYLEGIAPLRHWYINPNEKSNKYKSPLWS